MNWPSSREIGRHQWEWIECRQRYKRSDTRSDTLKSWFRTQGDLEDELSLEDLQETTARIHALLDAEAALASWRSMVRQEINKTYLNVLTTDDDFCRSRCV